MATYNGEKYIEEQLKSIIGQIAPDDEIVISDDASTDRTVEIIKNINDPRIRLYKGSFRNYRLNFENALKNANGTYIFLSDQDDVWLEGKYKRCVGLLEVYDLVVTDSVIVDENLDIGIESFFDYYHSGRGILKNIIGSTYFGASMAFRKTLLSEALPFPDTDEIAHDIWLGLVAELTGKVFFLHEPCLLYRRHSQSLTNVSSNILTRSGRPLYKKICGRLRMIYELAVFLLKRRFSCK